MMSKFIEINNKNIVIISLLLSIAVATVLTYSPLLIGLSVLSVLILLYGKKPIIYSTILTYLLLTSNNNENLRDYLNIFNLLILVFLFIYEFGLDCSSLKELPKEIKAFFLTVFISFFISSVLSEYIWISAMTFMQQIVFCTICFIYYSFFRSKQDYYNVIYSIIFTSIVLGLGIVYQIYTEGITSIILQSNAIFRPSGLYNNPNAVGLFYVISTPLIFLFFFIDKPQKYYYLVPIVFIFSLAILALTNSRASMAGVFISLCYILFILKRKVFNRISIACIIILFILIFIPSVQEFFMLIFRTNRIFANTREYFQDVAFDIIGNNLIFGSGPGTFGQYLYKFLPVPLGSFEEKQMQWAISGTAHNFFLFRMADLGILGFATAIWLFGIFFYYGNKSINYLKEKDRELYILSIGLKSIGLGLLTRSFFESTGLMTHGWITRDLPFWLVFILLISIYQKIPKEIKRNN